MKTNRRPMKLKEEHIKEINVLSESCCWRKFPYTWDKEEERPVVVVPDE
jgi:hypothetical protein